MTSSTSPALQQNLEALAISSRPLPTRAVTLDGDGPHIPCKMRAASQPPGKRLPILPASHTVSGRRSPHVDGPDKNGNCSPSDYNGFGYGVIGGARFGNALAGMGPARASSFSVAEHEPRVRAVPVATEPNSHEIEKLSLARTLSSHPEELPSQYASPFPTSPDSTPSISPAALRKQPLHPSPPQADENVSRSRSQSMATGARPNFDRPWLSSLEPFATTPEPQESPLGSNMSPFVRGVASLSNNPVNQPKRFQDSTYASARAAWGSDTQSALTSSITEALGGHQPPHSGTAATFGDIGHNGSDNRSGASSRRHSVSVVGGRGGRHEILNDFGTGFAPLGLWPYRGPLYKSEDGLGNALNLDIDQKDRGLFASGSLDRYSAGGILDDGSFGAFSQAIPMRGRVALPQSQSLHVQQQERSPSEDSRRFPSSHDLTSQMGGPRSRPDLHNQTSSSQIGGRPIGPVGAGIPRSIPSIPIPSASGPLGPIGSPPNGYITGQQSFNSFGRPPFQSMPPQGLPLSQQGARPQPGGPTFGYYGQQQQQQQLGVRPFQQQSSQQFNNDNRNFSPINTAFPQFGFPPSSPTANTSVLASSIQPQIQPPTSPSFSTLSLSDLGKGLSLSNLPPTTPLYIVTFKAGRRDVYYCPDPTLLISNGDRVIVEADRGSDLGTVVADQLTPMDVRDWQERQATKALLSGAREHQPPGLAVAGAEMSAHPAHGHQRLPSIPSAASKSPQTGNIPQGMELANMDLDTLLSGVGPGGQMEVAGTAVRGPLAKEVMPKRIFAKSSHGPEEQQRMREKMQDEYDAMMICREKVTQKGLPMQIVDAEYQWDRRKLTFYFKADKRVDFRDLTKENFRIFKSRIWMSMVSKDDPRS
nr:hypothetical protein L204_01031 [Cryptococcus depauperatus CBS 7855]